MDIQGLIIFLAIGAVAGYFAGILMKGGGHGLLLNIIIGIIGAVLGGYLFGLLGISVGGGIAGSLVTAVIGAIALLFIIRAIRKV